MTRTESHLSFAFNQDWLMKTIWMQHNGCDKWDQTSAKLKKVMKPWCIYLSLQGGRTNTEHSFLQVSLSDHSHCLHLHILQDWISISFTSKHTLKTEFQSQLGNLCPQRQFLQTVAVLWEALLGPLDRDVWEGTGFSKFDRYPWRKGDYQISLTPRSVSPSLHLKLKYSSL